MTEHERAPLRDIDRYLLEARAAHVYLDAAAGLEDELQRQRNVASARNILALLEQTLLEAAPADPLRTQMQSLCDRLRDRLRAISD